MSILGNFVMKQSFSGQRKKTHMMHFCFISNLASINTDIDSKKDKKAYNKHTWDYINLLWLSKFDTGKKPNLKKLSIYFNL